MVIIVLPNYYKIQCSLHTEKNVILNVFVTISLSNQINVVKQK